MVEAGEDAGFVQVRLNVFGLGDPLRARDFDRDGAVEIVIKGLIDLAESALAKPSQDRVTPDLRRIEKGVDPDESSSEDRKLSVEDKFSASSMLMPRRRPTSDFSRA
jgi:hypothetical protein